MGEVAKYRSASFSDNTKKSYSSQLKSYISFCDMMCVPLVPVTDNFVVLYAAYLARRLQPSSIKQYLNVIRLLHIECGDQNPCQNSWFLKSTLRGIEKTMGATITRKTPIHPTLLLEIKKNLLLFDPLESYVLGSMLGPILWDLSYVEPASRQTSGVYPE